MTDGPEYWESVAVEWRRARPRALWRGHCDAVNARLLERWLAPGRVGRVLKTDLFDEAVGEGLYGLLAARSSRVTGIDISGTIVSAAHQRHAGLEAVVADARSLPFADGSFDAVASISTLDHFNNAGDIGTAIGEIARVLKAGGRLIITMDNPTNPSVRLRNALPQRWLRRIRLVPYHVGVTAGRDALEAELAERGLTVLDSTAIMHCPRALAVMLAGLVDAGGDSRAARWGRARLVEALRAFERLEKRPGRFRTGHFVALLAEKRAS